MLLLLLQSYVPNFSSLVAILFQLLPVIFILMLFRMIKKLRFALPFLLVLGLFASPAFISTVAAAESASPGSTTTMMGFPVTQTFSGLTDSSYTIEVDDVDAGLTIVPDSQDQYSVTLQPPSTGLVKYELINSTSNVVLTWYVDNQDFLIYIVPILSFMVAIVVIKAIVKSIRV